MPKRHYILLLLFRVDFFTLCSKKKSVWITPNYSLFSIKCKKKSWCCALLLPLLLIITIVVDDVVPYFSHKVCIPLALVLLSLSLWFSCVSYRDGLGISSSHFFYVFSHVKLNLTYCSAVTNTPQAQLHAISITIFLLYIMLYMQVCVCVLRI